MKNAVDIQGYCDQQFLSVKEVFARNLEDSEVGASFAVSFGYLIGEPLKFLPAMDMEMPVQQQK